MGEQSPQQPPPWTPPHYPTTDDKALVDAWHELHPVKPWRGQDGRGGLLGWANRLDERVAKRTHLISPRSEAIQVSQRDVYRQVVRDWRALLVVVVGLALTVLVSQTLGLLVTLGGTSVAVTRARAIRRTQMQAELQPSNVDHGRVSERR